MLKLVQVGLSILSVSDFLLCTAELVFVVTGVISFIPTFLSPTLSCPSLRPFGSQFQLSSSLTATVELVTPHYLLCACSTLTGARLAYGVIDTVNNSV